MGIARKSVLGFVGQVYMFGVGLLSTIIIARLLGPEGKGVLALVAAIPSLALGIASFGLGPALSFMAGKNHYSAKELVTAAMLWSFVLSAVLGLVLWALRGLLLGSALKGMTPFDLAVVLIALPTNYITAFMGALFAGHGRAVEVAGISALATTLNLAGVVAASLLMPGNASAVVVALCLVNTICAVYALVLYRAGFELSPSRMVEITRRALPYAAKSYIGQATSMFFLRADVFFLNIFAGPTAVGIYSVATGLAEKLWMLSNPVSTAVYSQITGTERQDSIRLTTLTSRALLVLNGGAGLVLFGMSWLLIPVVYGARFSSAIWYLGLLLPGVVIYAVCQPYNQFFAGQLGRPEVTSRLSAVMMVLSAGLYVTLIPLMDAAGAAIGSTLSYSAALVGFAWLMPRTAGVGVREMLVPTRGDMELYKSLARTIVSRVKERSTRHKRNRL